MGHRRFEPIELADTPHRAPMLTFVLGVPTVSVICPAVVALTMLLIHSDWNDVIRLRYILMAHASACVLATLVDLKYFPTVAPQRMAGLVTFSTWITYFFMSTRVRSVFLTHDCGQTR
jgi:hypothetical protein